MTEQGQILLHRQWQAELYNTFLCPNLYELSSLHNSAAVTKLSGISFQSKLDMRLQFLPSGSFSHFAVYNCKICVIWSFKVLHLICSVWVVANEVFLIMQGLLAAKRNFLSLSSPRVPPKSVMGLAVHVEIFVLAEALC